MPEATPRTIMLHGVRLASADYQAVKNLWKPLYYLTPPEWTKRRAQRVAVQAALRYVQQFRREIAT